MNSSRLKVWQGYIHTAAEAQQATATLQAAEDVRPPGAGEHDHTSVAHDDTPVTDAEKVVFVRRLFDAFNNLDNTDETQAWRRTTAQTDLTIELLCWKFLEALIDVEHGRCPLPRSSVSKWLQRDDFDSFEDRFEAFETGLKHNKTMCRNLMDSDWVNRMAWNLGEELEVCPKCFPFQCCVVFSDTLAEKDKKPDSEQLAEARAHGPESWIYRP